MRPRLKIAESKKIIPDAFHGTSREYCEKILTTGRFRKSTGDHQYLGDGVYFFESQEEYAIRWARKRYGEDADIGIIRAIVDLGKCLNLTLPSIKSVLISIKRELEESIGREVTDAAVINFIATNIAQPDTVKGVIITLKDMRKIFPGSHMVIGEQIIICVRNSNCILDCRLACIQKGVKNGFHSSRT